MMNKRLNRIVSIVVILAGVLTAGAVCLWAQPCPKMLDLANGNQTHMKCWYSGRALLLLSILLIIIGIVMLLWKGHTRPLGLIAAVAGLMLIVSVDDALGFGICANAEMSCHTMALWARICAFAATAAGLTGLFSRQ